MTQEAKICRKSLHGHVPRNQNTDVDQEATQQWLRSSGLQAGSEGFMLVAQD